MKRFSEICATVKHAGLELAMLIVFLVILAKIVFHELNALFP